MKFPAVYWLTVAVSTALYALILTALLRRNVWRRMPVLIAYLIVVFSRDRIFLISSYFLPKPTASTFYWIGEGLIYVLSFLLVMSIWKEALGRLRGLWVVARWVLPCILLTFLAFVRWNAQFAPGGPPRPAYWGSDWFLFLSQNFSLTQALFLLGFFFITAIFSVPVAPFVQRIAACWFAYSLAKVVLLAIRYVVGGETFDITYAYVPSFAYLGLLLSWTVVLWRVQPSDLQAPQPVFVVQGGSGRLAGQLEAVNQTLSRLLKV